MSHCRATNFSARVFDVPFTRYNKDSQCKFCACRSCDNFKNCKPCENMMILQNCFKGRYCGITVVGECYT